MPSDTVPTGPLHPSGRPQLSEQLGAFAEAVLDVVELVPPGRVMTYGDVAEYLGRGGPRAVGTVMSRYGSAVPWWRVLRADGSPPQGHEAQALRHYRRERTPLRPGGEKVDLAWARWDGEPPPAPDLPA